MAIPLNTPSAPDRGTWAGARTRTESPAAALPAIVLGEGVTALGVVRCLGRGGIPSFLPSPRGDYASWSRWSQRPPQRLKAPPSPQSLADYLERLPVERAVVFPCSDDWTRAVAGLPSGVRERFASSVAAPNIVELFLDKAQFAELLERQEVPRPRTTLLRGGRVPYGWPQGSSFFLKPTYSQEFSRHFGVKALRVEDVRDVDALVAEAARADLEVMLQEYIPGPASSHYFVDGFAADGRVIARLARRRLRMYPADFGNSTYHATVPLEDVVEATSELDRLLGSVGYHGIFSAEFKRDQRDATLKLLEVNVRPWWYVEFAALCGVDVCRLAYRDALGLPIDPVDDYAVGARCVLPGADVRAFLSLRAEGLTFRSWIRSWIGASHTVFSLRDPLPSLWQLAEVGTRRLPRRRAAARGLRGRGS